MKHMSTKYRRVSSQFRSLTRLIQAQYDTILPVFSDLVTQKILLYNLKGVLRKCRVYRERKDSSLCGATSKLDFLLIYLKENPNQSHHGLLFEMSQSKVSEWVSFLLPVLEDSLHKMNIMPRTGSDFILQQPGNTDFLVMDVVERVVPGMTDYEAQKEEYSGKKKVHTVKNLAVTDQNKVILFFY
jgi:hypothetical protein